VAYQEKHYRWVWDFKSSPQALWPLVSDTDRSNRDCGFPAFTLRNAVAGEEKAPAGVRKLRSVYMGMVGEWEEREFEWLQPVHFAIERRFSRGPLAYMIQSSKLEPRTGGGTTLTYEMRVKPSNLLGTVVIPLAIGLRMPRALERVYRGYDQALLKSRETRAPAFPTVSRIGSPRLATLSAKLVSEAHQPQELVDLLARHVSGADEMDVAEMRPYALADEWGTDRRGTLDLFLYATRVGMLDFSWQVLCPHCRGSKPGKPDLSGITSEAHCDSCDIDFSVNFDQSVELTFTPNPSLRQVTPAAYCIGGPQVTPHVVAQQNVVSGATFHVPLDFPEGRYRVRSPGIAVQAAFRIQAGGSHGIRFGLGPDEAPGEEPVAAPGAVLTIENLGSSAHLAVVERIAWGDKAVTASAVTSRQIFRDLFSREILRQGERISVGVLTIVFTDLKNSTQLYREIGDATAFGRVLTHFDTIKAAVAEEGGGIVKTMGDAVMAAFTEPAAALRAMRTAQEALAAPPDGRMPFALKCSVHTGPCLAINQNERLDYFGTTVNVCARLCTLSTGTDIIISEPVLRDHGVEAFMATGGSYLNATKDSASLKGIDGTPFDFWRLSESAF
jgi:class 3 adenylate cyclase